MPTAPASVRIALAIALAALCAAALLAPGAARAEWRWPLRGEVAARFAFDRQTPYAAGQRRGVDLAAAPGATVRAACAGRVTFAGALPRRRLAVAVRCGGLASTYLGLGALAVRRGQRVRAGSPLGRLGARGVLRLGARLAHRRHGYVDPLQLIGGAAGVPLAPGPRSRRPPAIPAVAPRRRAAPLPPSRERLPALAWAGIALVAAGIPLGAGVRAGVPGRRRVAASGRRPIAGAAAGR